ncbi:MAG: TonB-dependent receptor [Ferruginibacter sp.]
MKKNTVHKLLFPLAWVLQQKKLLVIMKLSAILLFVTCMQVSAKGYSQKTISLSVQNIELKKLFNIIQRKTDWHFVYRDAMLPKNVKVDVTVDNVPVEEVLKIAFNNTSIQYKILPNNLIVLNEYSAEITVTGTVVDSTGKSLQGANITVKGNEKIGTTTDANGRFILDVPDNSILIISMVGYDVQELPAKTSVTVILQLSKIKMDDVVVTAFGKKQRKEAVVGSVTSISGKDLKIPSSNLTTAFAGRLAGVIAYQRTGEPGADNASFFIRGVTTFGNGSGNPLILIDNIELTTTDLARLQPDDIESFSILKDASATALYGARGANGVIFVTTKQGREGQAKLNIRVENSISAPTKKIELADPVTHMQLYSEAQLTRDPLAHLNYSQNKIGHTIAGGNPFVYPTTDWFKLMFKDRTSNQRANLSVTGGGKVAQYYVAGSYNVDHGILNVDSRNNFNSNVKLNSYQLRSNVNIQLTPQTELVVRLYGIFDDYKGPVDGGTGMYQKALRASPALFAPSYLPDSTNIASQHILFGNYRSGNNFYINPYAEMLKGYKEYSQSRMLAQLELNQKLGSITKGLNFRGLVSTNRYAYFDVSRAYGPYFYNISTYDKLSDKYSLSWLNETQGPDHYEDIRSLGTLGQNRPSDPQRNLNTNLYAQATLDYSRLFADKHNVGATLIYTMQQSLFTTNNLDVQSSLPHRNLGLSGRASYSYDNRYFTEFNFGYNGSERFYKSKQFGFFPTAGVAWVVSNENFWKSRFINKLKLRASYGLVGNDAIGNSTDRFFYLSSVNLDDPNRSAYFGYDNAYTRNGVSISRYPNIDITWEKSYQSNVAVELSLLNRLNIVAELYSQQRKNILMERSSIPTTVGLSAITQANVGEAKSNGVDLAIDYTQNFNKNLWLIARGSFTYARGEYVKYEEPVYAEPYKSHVGQSISQTWGYIAERLFVDEKDVQNSPHQNFGLYQAGDIKFRDVNGDGQITALDMVPLGNPTTPEITYGFGFSAGYKGFDFSVFLQGLARESFWINPYSTAPFVNYDDPNRPINNGFVGENALLQAYADSHWSEDNQNVYAVWPRLSVTPINNNNQTSTWFMRDGSFLRVKSLELGYSFNKKMLTRYKMANLRIYFSGTNLFTFSKFKLWDPEMGGNGLAYPIQKVFNLGINLNF